MERYGLKQKKQVYRVRNPGGILTLFILSWNLFKKIRDGIQWFFSSLKMFSLFFSDFILFSRRCSLLLMDFSSFSRCALVLFHWFFNVFACFSLFFIDCLVFFFMIFYYVLGRFLQFTCIFCIFAVPYTWKTRGRSKIR